MDTFERSVTRCASTGNPSRHRAYVVAFAALVLAVAVGFGVSSGVAASSTRAITVVITGSGNVQVTTTYRGRTGHYTLSRNRTFRLADGSRVTLVGRRLNGAAFRGWSGGGCRPSLARCVLTARNATVIRARFVATATKTTITCRNVIYNGSPRTPCSAQVTGQGGLRAAVGVVYVGNNTNAGTVTATATFAGNKSHLRSTARTTFVIAKASASLRPPSISNLPNSGIIGGSFVPAVVTTGDGVRSVSSNSSSVCTIDGSGKVTYIGVGTCSLTASIAEGTNYTAASGTAQTVAVGLKLVPVVSIGNIPTTNGVNGGGFVPAVVTTGDGVRSVSSNSSSVCTIDGSGKVTYIGVGTCSLTASVAAGTTYTAATGAAQTFAVWPKVVAGVVPLIIDTDIFNSVDDVGALATAFQLQHKVEANIVATIVNTRIGRPVATNSWKCAAALGRFYGSTNTLLGADTSVSPTGPDPTTNDFIGPCAGFASSSTPAAPGSAVSVYREALASQPNGSVVIASIGYLENLDALLHSSPDQFSPLNGHDLIVQKVKLVVATAGGYPSLTPKTNFAGSPFAAADVALNWPTKIVWSGYEVGIQVLTGNTIPGTVTTSPVRAAYTAFGTTPGKSYYSFDLTAVYHAVRPLDPAMTEVGPGTNVVNTTPGATTYGANTFTLGPGNQYYLSLTNATGLETSVNTLLDGAP